MDVTNVFPIIPMMMMILMTKHAKTKGKTLVLMMKIEGNRERLEEIGLMSIHLFSSLNFAKE